MPRILIVDDEESVRSILSEFLSVSGYDCEVAADAQEARNHLRSSSFDMVLSDYNMPGESGLDLLEHVFSEYKNTAGIMMTAIIDPGIKNKALEIGVSTYMHKPFSLKELLGEIIEALARNNFGKANVRNSHPACLQSALLPKEKRALVLCQQ